ncbi:hypothetical protein ES703_29953 [subsurface metagenome]
MEGLTCCDALRAVCAAAGIVGLLMILIGILAEGPAKEDPKDPEPGVRYIRFKHKREREEAWRLKPRR